MPITILRWWCRTRCFEIARCVAAMLVCSSAAADTLHDFVRTPEFETAVISPEGTYLAVTRHAGQREVLNVLRLDTMTVTAAIAFGEREEIVDAFWVTDTRLLIEPGVRYGSVDFKAPTGEIYGVDWDGSRRELLFGFRAGKMQTGTNIRQKTSVYGSGRVIDVLPDDPDHVLIESRAWSDTGSGTTAYRMDVYTGDLTGRVHAPKRNGALVPDSRGRVALSLGWSKDLNEEIHIRDVNGTFQPVTRLPPGQELLPLGSSDSAEGFLVVENIGQPTRALARWNPTTGERKTLWSSPTVDAGDTFWSWDGRRLYALRYMDHFPAYFYPEASEPLAVAHQRVRQAFPDDDVYFTSESRDGSRVVAFVSGDRNPGTFYVIDTQARKVTHQLVAREWFHQRTFAEMTPFELETRDRMKMRGYLTLPPTGPKTALPMVVLVHGGPFGIADEWGFNEEVQLLAAHGYAVLQLNFRGSGGLGREFEEAGHQQWGGTMQDDLTDATRWAMAEGVADPARVCIFGASYGGYAALEGAAKEPDLYRCAIGYAGVYDLPWMFRGGDVADDPVGESYLKRGLGTDEATLRERSPVNHAERIRAAVMLVHGGIDQRAPPQHAKRMRSALQKAGRPVDWLYVPGEGHGFFADENRLELYQRVLAFLDRHIGAGRAGEKTDG